MDVTRLRQRHDEFLAVAEAGGFGPPPAGEWDAGQILAHVALGEASGAGGLVGVVRRYGELLCDIVAGLTERELEVCLPVLIISKDQVLVDEPRPLRSLLTGFGEVHLPGHAEQLRGLRR
jgi:hypothetical protein